MRNNIVNVTLLVAVCGLVACSRQDSVLVKPAETVQSHPAVIPKPQPQVSPLRKKVLSLLEKKNYSQALELMNGRKHEGLEREYVLAVNGLLLAANDAFALGDFASAGRSYRGVLDAYPLAPALRDRVSHNPKQIRTNLETCASRTMEQGLEEYRGGRLESAIKKWKGLLTFSPGHLEARKAIDTATVQLQALHNMKNR